MKKILHIISVLALSFTLLQSKAQVVTGDLSADWTLTDINGVSYHLDSILDAGKTVFIDISATWCAPCWSYHNSGAFENLWVNHGPTGGTNVSSSTTNDCMVFFIEGDGTTNHACLIGDAANCSGSAASQGNWVTGVSHPMIDPTSSTTPTVTAFNNIYNLAYFPTCVMICPDRSMTEVDQFTTAQLYAAKVACSAATAPIDAEMMTAESFNISLASCDSVTPTFRFGNVGTSTLTSATITLKVDGATQKTINWVGSLATYASATVTGIKVGASSPGTHTITASISNPNGGVDASSSNNSTTASFIIYPTVGGPYVGESFESAGIPSNWSVIAGGSTTWTDIPTAGFPTTTPSGTSAFLKWYSISAGQIDYMECPPMSFANATFASLSFDVAYAQYSTSNPENDKLEVQVSTNCGTTWTSKYSKVGSSLKTAPPTGSTSFKPTSDAQWRHESVNLNTYAGQSLVLVRFKGTSDYGNNVYVDNVNFSQFGVGIKENEMANSVNVYPNPATNIAFVDFSLQESNNVSVSLLNALGQTILKKDLGKMDAGEQSYSIDAASLHSGLYFLNVKIGDNTFTRKITVNK